MAKETKTQPLARYEDNVMGDYTKRESNSKIIIERTIEKEQKSIDMTELANAVANAIINKLPSQKYVQINGQNIIEDYNDGEKELTQKTLEKLAKSMIIKRENNESNFKDLGNTSVTQKNISEINNSIDLLSNLEN
jgi:hypothetical protein